MRGEREEEFMGVRRGKGEGREEGAKRSKRVRKRKSTKSISSSQNSLCPDHQIVLKNKINSFMKNTSMMS